MTFATIIGVLFMTFVGHTNTQMPEYFTTQRIRAEMTTGAHADYLAQLLSNPAVQESANSTDASIFTNIPAQLTVIQEQWQKYGYGVYSIFDRQAGDFIGIAGYHTVVIDESGSVDVFNNAQPTHELELYALFMPAYWRRGYGFEVATELINMAFTHLPYVSIIAYIEPKNTAALQGIKKLNFLEEKVVIYNNKPHLLYRLQKPTRARSSVG